jgi:hypothetical protein
LRRSTWTLSTSLVAIGLSASIALAQQSSQAPASGASRPSADDSLDPSMASRPTRYLLRNGLDYLAYREYARALSFFRVVEGRQGELNELELKQLKNGISRAQQGLREAVNGSNKAVAQAKGRPGVQPGAFALARPPAATSPGLLAPAPTDPIRLVSAEMPATPSAELPLLPPAMPAPNALIDPSQIPVPARPVFGVGATRRPQEPELEPEPAPAAVPMPAPTADPSALPAQASAPVELPPSLPAPGPGASDPPAPLILEPSSPAPTALPSAPVELPPLVPSGSEPAPVVSPPVPMTPEPARAAVASRPDAIDPGQAPLPSANPEPLPAPEAPPGRLGGSSTTPAAFPRPGTDNILTPDQAREVERIAQRPNPDDRMPGTAVDPNDAPPPTQGSPRLELPRAPSPTEARPLRKIPVPEEFVNLARRDWTPNRKYWAAAGTCHMILYFQDPVLERYGQGVEQSLGPIGRYFSYPLDDPKQSNQRNQILQPFYSMGKLCFQIGTLPYKMVVDPPWEAEYDLGYYRPGDRIPPDTIMITPYGVGPPLKGRQY